MTNDYIFDNRGRIQKKSVGGYGWTPTTTFYYDGDAYLPVKTVTQWFDETGSLTITETYTYVQLDEQNNWTNRQVEVESVEETYRDMGEESAFDRETSKRTDTRTIEYFKAK